MGVSVRAIRLPACYGALVCSVCSMCLQCPVQRLEVTALLAWRGSAHANPGSLVPSVVHPDHGSPACGNHPPWTFPLVPNICCLIICLPGSGRRGSGLKNQGGPTTSVVRQSEEEHNIPVVGFTRCRVAIHTWRGCCGSG